ncbi:DUF6365 family protein [Saccharothrix variisporea]|uniref:Uncharacterized protein n=1 Tax=Saccharothrix variisporea TaxID=543527 RepID=A0A495XSR6_9PSEU|nr:DUF6365 family protein [Saccharothrix variisporea]RKT74708.1 hypothetical protein DFJ66_8075 [Saccharothrix variisporea]
MRLLFLSALRKTLHETTIGVDLAAQLAGAGIRSHFVVDLFNEEQLKAADLPHTLLDPSMGPAVRDVVRGAVHDFRPDAIVLADYLGHWMTFDVGYSVDPWFIDEFDLPVIPIDLYDLENTTREVEVLGRTVQVSDRILGMGRHLQPVPMSRPTAVPGRLGRPYRVTRSTEPLTAARRAEVRRSLGLGERDRLLMVPTLPWQESMRLHAGPATRELAARVPELVVRYLRRLPADTHFLLTGPVFAGVEGLPPDRVHLRPAYGAREYDELVGTSDAVWSFHLPSFALERAVFADVPGMLSVNGFDVAGPADADRLAEAFGGLSPTVARWLADYPGAVPSFHMWPLRWNSVLAPLMVDNPFGDAVERVELFDEAAVVGGLHDLLHDPGTRDRLAAARARYRDLIDALPPTPEVFLAATRELGIADPEPVTGGTT